VTIDATHPQGPPAEKTIEVDRLCKTFLPSDGPVLDDISFLLNRGQSLSVIGPSGCGKTTLLYILAGLHHPSSGTVAIRGRQDARHPAKTSFILQNFGLFPWKTVTENVALGLKIRRTPNPICRRITADLLDELGIGELARRYPVQLSGGQQQRVAIARALATDPDILLMDEPFSALDALTREHLQNIILKMWQKRQLTYMIVTHSVEEAVFLGSRIMVLSDRPTRVKAILPNPGFGEIGVRHRDCFFDRIRQIRQVMEI
jgi:ABC-type nitrate/sulfonate/bicarbonate transport system ATPase subunit